MNRSDKQLEIDRLRGEFADVRHAFLVGFKGVTVPQVTALRQKVRKAGSRYQVVKNTLFARAVVGLPLSELKEHFTGPTAVAWNSDSPVELAKVLKEFAATNPMVSCKAVLLDGQALGGDKLAEVAALPGIPELRARLVQLLASPMRRLVTALAAPSQGLATALSQRAEKIK